jgi:hypothetical protein
MSEVICLYFLKAFNVTYPKNVDSGSILAISKGEEFRSSLPFLNSHQTF